MKTVAKVFSGAAALAFVLPIVASAQPSYRTDLAYCSALSDTYIRYIGRDETSPHRVAGARPGDLEGQVAVAKCRQGDAASAIPTLERKLIDAKFTLPGRDRS